jgi:hypothetical protein
MEGGYYCDCVCSLCFSSSKQTQASGNCVEPVKVFTCLTSVYTCHSSDDIHLEKVYFIVIR